MSDIVVSIVAASPREVKNGGAGMRVDWGRAESPFGPCSLGWSGRGVVHLAFCVMASGMPDELRGAWPNADFLRNERVAEKRIREIFVKNDKRRIPVFVRGTAFQLKVWRALLQIPWGSVATYSSVAAAIRNPGSCRAVGTACGANPVAWLIPCHRVVHAAGAGSGYRWGAERKRTMLAAEKESEIEKIPEKSFSFGGEDGFRVKLHPVNRQFAVGEAHDLALRRLGRDLEAGR